MSEPRSDLPHRSPPRGEDGLVLLAQALGRLVGAELHRRLTEDSPVSPGGDRDEDEARGCVGPHLRP